MDFFPEIDLSHDALVDGVSRVVAHAIHTTSESLDDDCFVHRVSDRLGMLQCMCQRHPWLLSRRAPIRTPRWCSRRRHKSCNACGS